jgi:hypothetical protein
VRWKKLWKIVDPSDFPNKNYTYASVPFIGEIKFIYFSPKDKDNCSHLGYTVFDMESLKIIEYFKDLLVYPVDSGFFDGSGVFWNSIFID